MSDPKTTPSRGPEAERIDVALRFLRTRSKLKPKVGIVLGSGLGKVLDSIKIDAAVPYAEIPGFLPSTVAGHAGRLVLGRVAGVEVVVMQRRVPTVRHAPWPGAGSPSSLAHGSPNPRTFSLR